MEFDMIQQKSGLKSLFLSNWKKWQISILKYAESNDQTVQLKHAMRDRESNEGTLT